MTVKGATTTTTTTPAPAGRFAMFSTPLVRSLTLKLTLAFLCVGLIGALLVALFVARFTQRAVDQYVVENSRLVLVTELREYYQSNGAWTGVELVVRRIVTKDDGPGYMPQKIVLCNAEGRVVYGSGVYPRGTRIPAHERAKGQKIVVDDTTVGWLLGIPSGGRPPRGSPEAGLLDRITQAISYSAAGAAVLALVLGVLLARTLTQPLRELTAATQAVARGSLHQQVTVRSRDELGALAASFNQMSADLSHASALRRQMTADIAHDLRTPLSVILGYTEALREGKLPPSQDLFDTIHIEAQHLQHLIDDLRTLSLADAGELPLTRQSVAPAALLDRAAAAYQAQAHASGITLQVRTEPQLPMIQVDPERIAQVLDNLLSNALRFTPAGGTITLAANGQGNMVQLQVQDTGAGIAAEDLPHIFERFYRADASRQHDGSSGLGLAIAKGIVTAHGGTVTVHSVQKQGATFTVSLPVTPSHGKSGASSTT